MTGVPLAVLALVTAAWAFIVNGNRWPGSHPRVPIYVSTSLDRNVPYDGTFQDAIQAIQNAIDEWNVEGNSNLEFYYAGTTDVSEMADDSINAVIFKDENGPFGAGCSKLPSSFWKKTPDGDEIGGGVAHGEIHDHDPCGVARILSGSRLSMRHLRIGPPGRRGGRNGGETVTVWVSGS